MAHPLKKLLEDRIAIIDGAVGTTIRTYGMTEADIRGSRFRDSKKDLLNNGDLFSLTQPAMICDIHRRFLEAGADIVETNTFGATSITQSEFFVDDPREHGGRKDPAFYQKIIDDPFLDGLAWEINEQSARQCREWADRVANADGRQRFVAGAIGPPLLLSPSFSVHYVVAHAPVAARDLKATPTLCDALEERLIDVLIDEIGHVTYNRLQLNSWGLAQAKLCLPLVAVGIGSPVGEARALGLFPVPWRDVFTFEMKQIPEEIRRQAFIA